MARLRVPTVLRRWLPGSLRSQGKLISDYLRRTRDLDLAQRLLETNRFRKAIKPTLRMSMPSTSAVVGGRPATLHAIHVADAADAELEARAIESVLA